MNEITRRHLMKGAAAVAAVAALPAAAYEPWRAPNGILVSTVKSCGRHGNLGDWGPSIVGYQQDHECFSGVWMDADEFYEGYQRDVIYHPCVCHPKHCKSCSGTGHVTVMWSGEEALTDCEHCKNGWLGEDEYPDDRYAVTETQE